MNSVLLNSFGRYIGQGLVLSCGNLADISAKALESVKDTGPFPIIFEFHSSILWPIERSHGYESFDFRNDVNNLTLCSISEFYSLEFYWPIYRPRARFELKQFGRYIGQGGSKVLKG